MDSNSDSNTERSQAADASSDDAIAKLEAARKRAGDDAKNEREQRKALEVQLADAKAQLALAGIEDLAAAKKVAAGANAALEAERKANEGYKAVIQAQLTAAIEDIPEDQRSLVPEYDEPAATLGWITKNRAILGARKTTPRVGDHRGEREVADRAGLSMDQREMARRMGLTDAQYQMGSLVGGGGDDRRVHQLGAEINRLVERRRAGQDAAGGYGGWTASVVATRGRPVSRPPRKDG